MRAALLFLVAMLLAPWLYAQWAEPIVYMENWPDGSPKKRVASIRTIHGDYVFDGPSRGFHANGQPESEGEYRRGREVGVWRWFRDDGSLLAQGSFDDGSGDYRSFHPDGSVWWEGRRERGKRDGPWVARDPQGRKIREGDYVEDQPHGEWQYWSYEDSTDHYTGRWDHGVLLEDGAPVIHSAELGLSVGQHLMEFGQWLLWILAPWPVAFLLVAGKRSPTTTLLALLVVGICLQLFVLQLLLAAGLFQRSALLLVAALMLGVGLWRCRVQPELRSRVLELSASIPRLGGAGSVLFCAAFVVALTRLWTALVEAPTNFDALAYHLPIMADWVQSTGLVHRAEFGQVAFYAYGWETLGAASMLLLRDDAFIAIPNLYAWAVLLLSVVVLSRRLGASRLHSLTAALLFLVAPEVLRRLAAVQPDIALAAFALSGLAFSGFPDRNQPAWTAPLFASAALLLAVKMSAWVYLLAGCAVLGLWRGRAALTRGGFPPQRTTLLVSLLSLVVGLFWYVRNLLLTANPLGDLRVSLGSWTLFDGDLVAADAYRGSLARLFEWGNGEHFGIATGALQESFGVVFWMGLLALVLLAAAGAWKYEPTRRSSLIWMAVAFLVAGFIYWNTPYSADNGANGYRLSAWMLTNTRFAFPAFVLLAPFLARSLGSLGRWGGWLSMIGVSVATCWGLIDIIGPRYGVLLFACAAALFCSVAVGRNFRWALAPWVLLLLCAAMASFAGREERQRSRIQLYGQAYEYVLRNYPEDERLGYAMTQRRYPFVGPRLSHPVQSAVPLVDDAARWFEQLERDGLDVLLVGYGSASETGRVLPENVRPWLLSEASPFELKSSFQSQRRDIEIWERR